ncbi:MAG: 2-phospho-L-lactate transferase CofD family protein, partial [Actinomycetes bacterium]
EPPVEVWIEPRDALAQPNAVAALMDADLIVIGPGSLYTSVLPNLLVSGIGGDYSSFICIQPETASRVRAKLGLIFYGEDWPQAAVDHAVTLFNATMAEDKAVLVDLMRGMASSHHARGPLAPADFEGPVLDFYRFYSKRLSPVLSAT